MNAPDRGCECVSRVLGGAGYANHGPMVITELQVQAPGKRSGFGFGTE